MTDLEKLLDDDFNNIVPMHLRQESVDTQLINEIIKYSGNSEIYETLYSRMNLDTESAFHETVDWHFEIESREQYTKAKFELHREREEIQQNIRKIIPNGAGDFINHHHTKYLIEQGLPMKKINWWRKFLLARDLNTAIIFGRMADELEPDETGRFHGLYSAVGYPVRKGLRDLMLNDGFFGYRLAKLATGYFNQKSN
jgi:hypothetical protein